MSDTDREAIQRVRLLLAHVYADDKLLIHVRDLRAAVEGETNTATIAERDVIPFYVYKGGHR